MVPTTSSRRIVVALDDSGPSRAALATAAALAARLGASLEGIFVRDPELLQLARLPLALETGLASARRRRLSSTALERVWRAREHSMRNALEAAGSRWQIHTSMQVIQGPVESELLRVAGDADLLAFGGSPE